LKAPAIIISGPSGIGKSTIIDRLLQVCQKPLRLSISATTRPPRGLEQPGAHYHFWSKDEFEKGIAEGKFLEWAIVHKRDYYGSLVDEVLPHLEQGTGVILEIDVQGAEQVRKLIPSVYSVFLCAPMDVIEARLRNRKTETEESIQRRLQTARTESLRSHEYDLELVNDLLEVTVEKLRGIVEQLYRDSSKE
jgi:guanylate kinase